MKSASRKPENINSANEEWHRHHCSGRAQCPPTRSSHTNTIRMPDMERIQWWKTEKTLNTDRKVEKYLGMTRVFPLPNRWSVPTRNRTSNHQNNWCKAQGGYFGLAQASYTSQQGQPVMKSPSQSSSPGKRSVWKGFLFQEVSFSRLYYA